MKHIFEFIQSRIVKLCTRSCDGRCGDGFPHDAHLSRLGRVRYLGGV